MPEFIGAPRSGSLRDRLIQNKHPIQQPDVSWGNLLSLATNASIIVLQPWLIIPPAFMIITTVLAFNVLGDGLRDVLDPKSLQSQQSYGE